MSYIFLEQGHLVCQKDSEYTADSYCRCDLWTRMTGYPKLGCKLQGYILLSNLECWVLQGAGIFAESVVQMDMTNVTLLDARATASGGGLYLGSIDSITGKNLSLAANSAQTGGGIVCDAATTGSILNSEFLKNNAPTGSALYAACGCVLEVLNSTFESIGNSNENPVYGDPTCANVDLVNCTSSFVALKAGFSWWTIILIALFLLLVIGVAVIVWGVVPAVSHDVVVPPPSGFTPSASMDLVEPLVEKA